LLQNKERQGWIEGLWTGTFLIRHKSRLDEPREELWVIFEEYPLGRANGKCINDDFKVGEIS
jgi:hypothetical protein